MPTYIAKPSTVEAIQLNWANESAVELFLINNGHNLMAHPLTTIPEDLASDTCGEYHYANLWLSVRLLTIHNEITHARHGDWIVAEERPGCFYPCKPDVFARKYVEFPSA